MSLDEVARLHAELARVTAERDEARRRVVELEHLPKRIQSELRAAEAFCTFAYSAWLWDRAEQYENASACRAVFDELFEAAATGEPLEAARRGEYQDLADEPPLWMRGAVAALREPSDDGKDG